MNADQRFYYDLKTEKYIETDIHFAPVHRDRYVAVDRLTYAIGNYFNLSPAGVAAKLIDVISYSHKERK